MSIYLRDITLGVGDRVLACWLGLRARSVYVGSLGPRRVHVHIVEGPYPVDGTWSFEPDGDGTRVHFVAEGELRGVMRVLQPVAKLVMARQMAGYHRNLRRKVEAG